jgi:WxL domain surface cell wall-binding
MVLGGPDSLPVPYEPFSYRSSPSLLTGGSDSDACQARHPFFKEHLILMRQRILILSLVAAAALVATTAALASSLTATATISGTAGVSLNVPATATVSDTIDGTDQTASYAPVLNVTDARGLASGGGWNLTIAATALSDGNGHTLGQNLTSVSSACHAGSTCTNASSSGITYPLSLSTTAQKFFSTASNTGLGKVDVTPTIQVPIPGNSYAGTYTSTLTIASATGP